MSDLHYKEGFFNEYDHADKMRRGYHFTIDYHGRWYCHDESMSTGPFKRKALAGLFAGAGKGFMAGKGLSIDKQGEYWLKSPGVAYKVEVEDVPFLITRYDVHGRGKNKKIDLVTNFDEIVELGPKHKLEVAPEPINKVDVLYVEVRGGLKARFNHSVYNDFVMKHLKERKKSGKSEYMVRSRGVEFSLGVA